MNDFVVDVISWRCLAGVPQVHPPYTIHKIGGKFFVKNALGEKKNKVGYDSEVEAEKLQAALYAALPKPVKKGGM